MDRYRICCWVEFTFFAILIVNIFTKIVKFLLKTTHDDSSRLKEVAGWTNYLNTESVHLYSRTPSYHQL
jgi:hypothetical protein